MNKLAVAVAVVILLAVYGVLTSGYLKQGSEQDRLLSEIEEIDQSIQDLEEPPPDRLEELVMLQASLAAEQETIPSEVNNSDVIEAILNLAQETGVKAIPLVTAPWSKRSVGTKTYRVFQISVEVEGTFAQVSEFIDSLENGEFNTLLVDQLNVTVAGEESEVYAGEATPVVAELDLVVLAQFLTD
ncbi:MAG TPA: hypothetical protein G4O10_11195 [Dehalococcoidia bacterium]|nr:hypothetical protein [Dehalococcoidia bacterium]